jgi:hypothetical protein
MNLAPPHWSLIMAATASNTCAKRAADHGAFHGAAKTLVTTLVELAVEKGFFREAGIDAKP